MKSRCLKMRSRNNLHRNSKHVRVRWHVMFMCFMHRAAIMHKQMSATLVVSTNHVVWRNAVYYLLGCHSSSPWWLRWRIIVSCGVAYKTMHRLLDFLLLPLCSKYSAVKHFLLLFDLHLVQQAKRAAVWHKASNTAASCSLVDKPIGKKET